MGPYRLDAESECTAKLLCRWVMRLGNIATLSREWAAIKRAARSPVRDILLSGSVRALPPAQHLQVPRGLLQQLNANYNESQYEALTAGLDGRPLILIQGPPGTGKTQCVPPPTTPPRISLCRLSSTMCSGVTIHESRRVLHVNDLLMLPRGTCISLLDV